MLQPQIQQAVEEAFDIEFLELLNESHMHSGPATESHFKLTVVSNDFEGLTRVKRQLAIYKVLSELMPLFHALALHTYTSQEWQDKGHTIPDSPKCASKS